jgi:hypothetical protein
VHEILLSNRDTLLLTGPMVFMLLLALLRLDGHLATPARSLARRPVHQFDSHGEIILTDPDGRPSAPGPPREMPQQTRQHKWQKNRSNLLLR